MQAKRIIWVIGLIICLTVFTVANDGGMQFVFQAGVLTPQNLRLDPIWGAASATLAIHLNDFILLAPECALLVPDFKFDRVVWAPGATLNFEYGTIFIGGGLSYWLESLNDITGSEAKWRVKAQIGLMSKGLCITLFAYMPSQTLFEDMLVGLTAGICL